MDWSAQTVYGLHRSQCEMTKASGHSAARKKSIVRSPFHEQHFTIEQGIRLLVVFMQTFRLSSVHLQADMVCVKAF